MHRQQLQLLHDWLNDNNRKPLIIRGARQVGKSTLVELFARQYKKTLLNVNLERYPELSQIFAGKDPDKIIQQIEFLPHMNDINKNALLFLDEIQAVPEAISALRYFYEDKPEPLFFHAGRKDTVFTHGAHDVY